MTFYQICTYFAIMFEGVVAWIFFEALFERVYSKKITLLAVFAGYLIHLIAFFVVIPILNIFIFLIINFIILTIFYDASLFRSIFYSTVLAVFMVLNELVVMIILGFIWGDTSLYNSDPMMGLLFALINKLLYYISIQLLAKILSRDQNHVKNKLSWLLWINPIVSVYIYIFVGQMIIDFSASVSTSSKIGIIFTFMILLLSNVMIFVFYQKNQELNQRYIEAETHLQKESDDRTFYKSLDEQNQKQAILIHDIRNHLNIIKNMSSSSADIINYINEIENSSALKENIKFCDNHTLNLILSRYYGIFKKNNTSTILQVAPNSLNFIDNSDITSLFANLFENAYEATHNIENSFIDFKVKFDEDMNKTIVIMVNSYIKEAKKSKWGELVSTKRDNKKHGYGLKSIRNIIEKYNGEYTFYTDDTDYTFHFIIEFDINKIMLNRKN